MAEASAALEFEKAARLRDEIAVAQEPRPARGRRQGRAAGSRFTSSPARDRSGLTQGARARQDAAHDRGHRHRPSRRRARRSPRWCPSSTACRSSRAIGDIKIKSVRGRRRLRVDPGSVYRRFRASADLGEEERALSRHPPHRRRQGAAQRRPRGLSPARQRAAVPDLAGQARGRNLSAGQAEPMRLSRHSAALRLLQYVRDEAHRFAQHYLTCCGARILTVKASTIAGPPRA